jgi:hypothetical protein
VGTKSMGVKEPMVYVNNIREREQIYGYNRNSLRE